MGALAKKQVQLFPVYTDVYHEIKGREERFVVMQGGTYSSKTYSILQLLCLIAIQDPGVRIDVVAMTAESLEVGAITDFKRLIDSSDLLRLSLFKPELQKGPFRFKNGSVIRFRNVEGNSKARHGKREYTFFNECNTLDYATVRQIMMRTTKQVFIDYNPDAEFWVHEEIIPLKDCYFGISNFTNNKFTPPEVVADLYEMRRKWEESIKRNDQGEVVEENTYWRNQWEVYGLGLTGVVEGVIFKNVEYVVGLPLGMKRRAFALDFGYKNDPTALILVGMKRGGIYAKELIYETGLTTPQLIKKLEKFGIRKYEHPSSENGYKAYEGDLIICDSAGVDAIAQLQAAGYNAIPCFKGPGSIENGIAGLQGFDIFLTKDSKNFIHERNSYKYKKVQGRWTNVPIDKFNHCWDALRYWYQHFFKQKPRKTKRTKRRIGRVRL